MAGRKVYCVGNGIVARVFADSAEGSADSYVTIVQQQIVSCLSEAGET